MSSDQAANSVLLKINIVAHGDRAPREPTVSLCCVQCRVEVWRNVADPDDAQAALARISA